MSGEFSGSKGEYHPLSDTFLQSWLKTEMGYSLDKINNGYEIKLGRMNLGTEPGGVYGNMGNYWFRARRYLDEAAEEAVVSLGLQQMGKMVAGLCDKVGLQIWLAASKALHTDTRNLVLSEVFIHAQQLAVDQGWEMYSREIWKDWDETLMAKGILEMQEQFIAGRGGESSVHQLVVSNAAHGLNILRATIAYYEGRGLQVGIADAGVPGGGYKAEDRS